MTIRQNIYAVLDKLLEPASLPAPWHHFPAPPDYRAPLRDFRAAVDLLLQNFSENDLVSAGVIKRRKGGAQAATSWAINPCLVLGNLLLLRRDFSDPPYEIVSAAGCISGSEPPLLAALHDAATQRLLESFGDTLFATFTIQDTAIFQSLGLPAMPAVDLERLQGKHFVKFCAALDVRPLIRDPWEEEEEEEEAFGGDSGVDGDHPSAASSPPVTPESSPDAPAELPQGESATEAALPGPNSSAAHEQPSPDPGDSPRQSMVPEEIELCLVAWHLGQLSLDEPGKLAEIDAHLRGLASNLELLMDQISVWRPAPDLAVKLRYVLTSNLPKKHVKRMLASSRRQSTRPLIARENAPPIQPLTIREAWEPLQQGGERQDDFRAENVEDFQQMIYREVTEPLLEQAEALTDPEVKARALVQAQYLTHQLKLLPQLGLGGKAPQPGRNGLLRTEDADTVRAAQKSLSDFLDSTDPARKISSR